MQATKTIDPTRSPSHLASLTDALAARATRLQADTQGMADGLASYTPLRISVLAQETASLAAQVAVVASYLEGAAST